MSYGAEGLTKTKEDKKKPQTTLNSLKLIYTRAKQIWQCNLLWVRLMYPNWHVASQELPRGP
jgi:hypothetical protein